MRNKATKWLSRCWRWSLWVTLPVACVFCIWFQGTASRWWNYGVRHLTMEKYSLVNVGRLEGAHMKRLAAVGSSRLSLPGAIESSGLRPIQLYISTASRAQLDRRLPDSGFEYKKGQLIYNGGLHPVKVRYRGDSSYHWGYWKKSWRIKTDREVLFEGMRKFNLIAPRTPELLNNHLGHRLATSMGLISPKSEVVPVLINGGFAGIYSLTEQLEESTLRRAGRMPGDLYAGDIAGRDGYTGLKMKLFEHPGGWRKIALNNHFPEAANDPLKLLLELIRDHESPQAQAELSELLDMQAFGRFSAFEALAGTVHYDFTHNWRLYYDPWETKFVPLVWDPVAWVRGWRPRPNKGLRLDVISSPMHLALFHNGDFLRARERAFQEFFADGTADAFLAEVNQTRRDVDPLIDHDGQMVTNMRLLGPQQVRSALREMEAVIRDIFSRQERAHLTEAGSSVSVAELGDSVWAVQPDGRRQLLTLEFTMDQPVVDSVGCVVRWKARGREFSADVSGKVSVTGNKIIVEAGLLSRYEVVAPSMVIKDTPDNHMNVEPGYYELALSGLPPHLRTVSVRAGFMDGSTLTCEKVAHLEPVDMGLVSQLVRSAPVRVPAVWSGDVMLDGLVELDDLVIEPGTTIRCAPDAVLLLRGRLTAMGTEDAPIRFVPREEGQGAWGAIILKTAGANGSRLRHCQFERGSGWKLPLAEYSAMVSVHGVQDVRFDDCTFVASQVVDDMVHGVYSDIVFKGCVFRDSLSDALDMDISNVVLDGCTFERSGNDALDLMTSMAVVVDCLFADSGDKGVSVGERSKLLLISSTIRDCDIGVQAKDDSVALAINVDFIGNRLAFDAYKKNWRYDGGGLGRLVNCWIEGSGEALTADKHSSLTMNGCYMAESITDLDSRRVILGHDMLRNLSTRDPRKARSFALGSAVKDWGMDRDFFARHAGRVHGKVRGRQAAD